MFELLKAGGILMVPIVACSILALAIILERFWTLRPSRVAPPQTVNELWRWIKKKELNGRKLKALQGSGPRGRIIARDIEGAKPGQAPAGKAAPTAEPRQVLSLEQDTEETGG